MIVQPILFHPIIFFINIHMFKQPILIINIINNYETSWQKFAGQKRMIDAANLRSNDGMEGCVKSPVHTGGRRGLHRGGPKLAKRGSRTWCMGW